MTAAVRLAPPGKAEAAPERFWCAGDCGHPTGHYAELCDPCYRRRSRDAAPTSRVAALLREAGHQCDRRLAEAVVAAAAPTRGELLDLEVERDRYRAEVVVARATVARLTEALKGLLHADSTADVRAAAEAGLGVLDAVAVAP